MKQLKHNLPNDGRQQRSQKSGVCVCVCVCLHMHIHGQESKELAHHILQESKELAHHILQESKELAHHILQESKELAHHILPETLNNYVLKPKNKSIPTISEK